MWIEQAGMVCAVGLTAPASVTAIRAGISRLRELPFHDGAGERVIGATVPLPGPPRTGLPRLVAMLQQALEPCLYCAEVPLEHIPLLVAVAEPGRSASKSLQEHLQPALEMSLGTRFHPQHSRLLPEGKAAGLAALQRARELLDSGRVKACLVAGVDSFINAADLQQASRERRLKTRKNSDGFNPGEAAAALLLRARKRPEVQRRVDVSGIGLDQEQATISSGKPILGIAMTQAARKALAEARMQMHEVDLRLADLNGEQHGFMEQAHAIARLVRQRKPTFPLEYMADCIGEVGAASGPCLMAMGWHNLLSEETTCRSAMIFSSSDLGLRATAILRREEN